MTKDTKGTSQGKDQAGGLDIPKFGADAPVTNIQQEGESDDAFAAVGTSVPLTEAPGLNPVQAAAAAAMGLSPAASAALAAADAAYANATGPAPEPMVEAVNPGKATVAPEPAAGDDTKALLAQMAESMKAMQAQIAMQSLALQQQARNNPVRRDGSGQFMETPNSTVSVEIPIDGDLTNLDRPDHNIEPVNMGVNWGTHAEQLRFLEERVIIRVAHSNEAGAEDPVVLYVNGRSCIIRRGENTVVRRKYVEQLLRAKPERVTTRITRDRDDEVRNHVDKRRSLKYPFEMVRDDNPMGRPWYAKILAEQ